MLAFTAVALATVTPSVSVGCARMLTLAGGVVTVPLGSAMIWAALTLATPADQLPVGALLPALTLKPLGSPLALKVKLLHEPSPSLARVPA